MLWPKKVWETGTKQSHERNTKLILIKELSLWNETINLSLISLAYLRF